MNISRFALLAAATLLPAGCHAPIPTMVDPLAGLAVTRPATDQRIADLRNARVALIVSENTKNIIAWQKATGEQQKESIGAKMFLSEENRQATQALMDPANIVSRVSAMLRTNFPNLAVAPDLPAAEKSAAGAVLFDVQVVYKTDTGLIQHTFNETWTATFYFFRTDGSKAMMRELVARRTGSVTGSGNELVRLTNELEARLRTEVFDELEAKLAAAMK